MLPILPGTGYSKGASYTLTTGDDILIAQWKANTNTRYRVYHYLVSSDGLSASLAEKGEESLTETTGKTVWAKAKEIPGYKYNAGFDSNGMKTVSSGVVAADGSLVLSLYYIPNSSTEYTVEHYIVGADGAATIKETEKLKGTTGERVTASAIKITGYDYDADFDSNGMKTVASGIISGDGSLVLKLYYTLKKVPLVYHINDGTTETEGNGLETEKDILFGTSVTVKSEKTFSREGYTFEGWNTKADGTGKTYQPESKYNLTAEENHLYAQWKQKEATGDGEGEAGGGTTEEKPKDNLTYDPNGGSGEKGIRQFDEHSVIIVESNSYTREGYEFTGWNTKADGTGAMHQPGAEYTLTDEEDILYAQWKQKAPSGETDSDTGGEGGETGGDNGGSTGGETAPDTGNDGDKEPGSSVEKGSNTEKAESDEMAATGDSSHIMTGSALALLSLLGIAGVALKRRRKNS